MLLSCSIWPMLKCLKLFKPKKNSSKSYRVIRKNSKKFWDLKLLKEIRSWATLLFKANRLILLGRNMRKRPPNCKGGWIQWMMGSMNASKWVPLQWPILKMQRITWKRDKNLNSLWADTKCLRYPGCMANETYMIDWKIPIIPMNTVIYYIFL